MSRVIAGSLGAAAACAMAGLIGVIAITGRWPVDAPRTHLEPGGILSVPPQHVASVEFAADGLEDLFRRDAREGWLVNGTPTGAAVAAHIDTALRLLTISAPRRVLSASDYGPGQLVEYGLDPPLFVLALAEPEGGVTRVAFGEATPAQNAQYVRIIGRPEIYLLPRDVGEEWQLARDMAERAAANLLLPVSIAQVWAIEIVSGGALYRFERDPAGLWFHHTGQHVHLPGGFVHHADPAMAPLIEAELGALDRSPIARVVARHPDAGTLAGSGFEHPATIVLLYSRDSAGPVARIELGSRAADGSDRCARIQQNDLLAIVPDDVSQHLERLVQVAGSPS
jgi:Domain of unknown function (DUF4340)